MVKLLTLSWVATPQFVIAVSFGVLMCGQILWWRRRDNVLAYSLIATWVVTILIPLYGTSIVHQWPSQVVWRVAWIFGIGAGAYLVGLAFGGGIGSQIRVRRIAAWTRPFDDTTEGRGAAEAVYRWARRFGVAAVVMMVGAFGLLGYVPALASDRTSAKYGVGPYAAGFARGGNVYHLALALASVALPILMITTWRRPSARDIALCVAIFVCLLLTLSRQDAFSGPLLVLVAIAVERRTTPVVILSVVCISLFAGTVFNELILPSVPGSAGISTAQRVADSFTDDHDAIAFLSGFETLGNHFVGAKNLEATFIPSKGKYNPASYSVETETLLPDASGVGTGGIRLQGPEWGYVAYGWLGVVVWSLLSGLFAGLGTVVVRRMMDGVAAHAQAAVNFVLAWVFFNGTFSILQDFYFPERATVVLFIVAMVFSSTGMAKRRRARRQAVNDAFWAGAGTGSAPSAGTAAALQPE